MRMLGSKKIMILLAGMVAAAALAAVAIAAITSSTVLADGNTIHYRFVRNVALDLDTGWHIHPGLAVVQVEEGALQITQGSCTPKTVRAGETSIEAPYTPVRATATGRVVFVQSLIVRAEEPLASPVPSPCP